MIIKNNGIGSEGNFISLTSLYIIMIWYNSAVQPQITQQSLSTSLFA